MEALSSNYQERLDQIAEELIKSDTLARYLEDEEEEEFQALRNTYEPRIIKIYAEVAAKHPLQLTAFEQYLLDPKFEGVFLPRLLGYSVLRGEINERNYKYARPQNHFQDILEAICNSSNFDYLKKRIGQSIQIAFSLSSDIWVTNLINSFENKRIRYFLQGQKLDKYRDERNRKVGYSRYLNQFKSENFYTADFPTNKSELKILFSSLKTFLIYRVENATDNTSLIQPIKTFLENEIFQGTEEYIEMLSLYGGFFERTPEDEQHLKDHFAKAQSSPTFNDQYFNCQLNTLKSKLDSDGMADQKVSALLDRSQAGELTRYFDLMDTVHGKTYISDEAIEAVKTYYNLHSGLSIQNECVRYTILSYLKRLISNLSVGEYHSYFEIAKIFPTYMGIFGNQKFNQDIKDLSMVYIKKLLKTYTDKRGKDYQDIKKFVATNFVDLKFLKKKEVVELFKTRRKRNKPVS